MTVISDIINGQMPFTASNEGCRLEAYPDPVSGGAPITIGYGHTGHGIELGLVWTQEQADAQLMDDLQVAADGLSSGAPWWSDLDAVRAGVLLDMAFNVGAPKFLTWHHTLGYAQGRQWEECGVEIAGSQPWASQVGNRSVRNSNQMKTGVYQSEPANG